jgi:hypothetical protein
MSIKYDSNKVIRPNTKHHFTEEMIKEYAKCYASVEYFANNHCKVTHPIKGIIQLEPRPYQQRMLNLVSGNRLCVLNCARQCGKCVFCDTVAKFRNKITGEIVEVTLKDFFDNYL